MLGFPTIPEVANHVLGAVTLNSYKQGCEYLLGVSHGPQAATHGVYQIESTSSTYVTIYTFYAMYDETDLFYAFSIKQDSGDGRKWNWRVQYYGDHSAWVTVTSGELSGTETTLTLQTGTLELDGHQGAGLNTPGKIYKWRVQIKRDAGTAYTVTCTILGLGMVDAISDWAALPTFGESDTSAAADFNAIRTNLNNLYTHMRGAITPLTPAPAHTTSEGTGETTV